MNSANKSSPSSGTQQPSHDFTLDELWKQIFIQLDESRQGSFSALDLRTVMRKYGFTLSEQQSRKLISAMDRHGRGVVIEGDFIRHMKTNFGTVKSDMKKLFEKFDTDKDGFLTKEELRMGLRNVGVNPPDDEFEEMVKVIDTNRDGKICYDEFVNAML